jgi:hypothetical protein
MRDLFRRLRRRRLVVVDEAAWQRMCELAVIGETLAVLEQAELDWLLMSDASGDGPWHD